MKNGKLTIYVLILMVLLPAIFGVFSYIQEMKQRTSYTGSITIDLGNVQESKYTKFPFAQTRITSSEFQQMLETITDVDVTSGLELALPTENTLLLNYTNYNPEIIESVLVQIATSYVEESRVDSQKYKALVEETVKRLKSEPVSGEDRYEVENFIYELDLRLLNWKEAEVTKQVEITSAQSNPLKSAIISGILGFSIGLLLLFVLLIINFKRNN